MLTILQKKTDTKIPSLTYSYKAKNSFIKVSQILKRATDPPPDPPPIAPDPAPTPILAATPRVKPPAEIPRVLPPSPPTVLPIIHDNTKETEYPIPTPDTPPIVQHPISPPAQKLPP